MWTAECEVPRCGYQVPRCGHRCLDVGTVAWAGPPVPRYRNRGSRRLDVGTRCLDIGISRFGYEVPKCGYQVPRYRNRCLDLGTACRLSLSVRRQQPGRRTCNREAVGRIRCLRSVPDDGGAFP